ncbi:MAG: exodeoxyribonuclease V subunit alpha [Marmoricola sp.]
MAEQSSLLQPSLAPVLAAHDRRLARSATGLLARFNELDVLRAADVHVATTLAGKVGDSDDAVLLAAALAVRAVRSGSVCVDLATIAEVPLDLAVGPDRSGAAGPAPVAADLPWPDPVTWVARVRDSALVREHVLCLEGTLLYLDRYWREEQQVVADLRDRLARRPPEVAEAVLDAGVLRVFPAEGYDEQRAAARAAVTQWTTVLTGGPGTGKTTTAAGLLALLVEQSEVVHGRRPRIALAAPTARAGARLQEAVAAATAVLDPADRERLGTLSASTLHRLLGWRPDSSVRFRHDRHRRLPYDVVVVDEASMVSLTMMARLLEALRPQTRLVLLGDPAQLVSVEAGAVLADLVQGFAGRSPSPVVELTRVHRFGGGIGTLADALRAGDADRVLDVLGAGLPDVELVAPADEAAMARVRADILAAALGVRLPAESGDVATAVARLDEHRLLCAHRDGPYGVSGWNRQVEHLLTEETGVAHYEEWYAGRPVLVTANDRGLGLYNGDLGVTVREPDGRLRVHVAAPTGVKGYAPSRLPEVQTVYAMTVHKSQGSQARRVTVVMPPEESQLLTRELFYTAVTRAQEKVRIIGTPASVRAAVERQVQRASGLAEHLAR